MTNSNVGLNEIGDIEYAGKKTNVSDECLKENIKPIYVALEKIFAVSGVYFNMIDTPIGVIA